MGIDASIIAGIRPVQFQQQDPLESYGKSLTLQNLMRQGDLQGLQVQSAQRGLEDENAVRDAYKQAGGDSARLRALLGGSGQYKQIQALDKLDLENKAKNAQIGKDEAAAEKSRYDTQIGQIQHGSSMMQAAKENPAAWPAIRRAMQLTFPKIADQLPEQYDAQFIDAKIAAGQTLTEKLKAEHDAKTLGLKTANEPFKADGTPNAPVQAFQLDKAKKSAPNVQVKTDVKTGESLAQQIGPMMRDSTGVAEGAVKQVDAAQRIVKAVDSGNLIAGPLANQRVTLAQVGQILGVGGKDEAEKIANTRQTVRGLAELTLQGRQQMKGQGAITESEGKLAEKAMSGDINDLTLPEIRQLAKASERAARFNHGEHARKLTVMQGNPDLAGIAPFYQGPAMPAEIPEPAPAGKPGKPGGIKFLGFEKPGGG